MSHHSISHLRCDHAGCFAQLTHRGGDVYAARIAAREKGWECHFGTPSNRRGRDLCRSHRTTPIPTHEDHPKGTP